MLTRDEKAKLRELLTIERTARSEHRDALERESAQKYRELVAARDELDRYIREDL